MSARMRIYTSLPKDTYKRVLEDVVVAVNMLHMEYRESKGKRGIDPNKNYNMVYDKRKGQVFVEFWYGPKSVARASSGVERYTVHEVCSNAREHTGGAFEAFKKKEVII
jgi:hypothetical protein